MSMSPRDLAMAAATIYSRRLRAFIARRVDNPQDIEDVAQSTIVKILKIPNDRFFIRKPFGFLCKVALLELAERRHRAARDRTHIEWSDDVEKLVSIAIVANCGWCPNGNPEGRHYHHDSDLLEEIRKALDQMSPTLSAPLVLFAHGFSYAEIALKLGTNVEAVKKNIQRARAELKARMSYGKGDGQG